MIADSNKLPDINKFKTFEKSDYYKITGMNPKASFGNKFRSKLRGIIPSDFVGIVQLRILFHFVHKIQVSRINPRIFRIQIKS